MYIFVKIADWNPPVSGDPNLADDLCSTSHTTKDAKQNEVQWRLLPAWKDSFEKVVLKYLLTECEWNTQW